MSMPGVTYKEIQDAIVDAYDQADLEMVLRTDMNIRMDVEIDPGKLRNRVFDLIGWAEQRGREVELIRATSRARPQKLAMQEIYRKYGLAVPVYAQASGVALAGAPSSASSGGLEAIVSPYLKSVDIGLWRDKLTLVEGQVCRITLNGKARGTGFLVGPDLVLTNYHVMKPVLEAPARSAEVRCQFDYKRVNDGTQLGDEYKLHSTDWRLDDSPYSRAEAENQPDREPASDDELDYALIRLADPVGSRPVAKGADPAKAEPRGWVKVPTTGPAFAEKMAVIIAQHPSGAPMKLALDTQAIDKSAGRWLQPGDTRVRYATNTEGGSSGSPCFDFDWNLIALHHYGDPEWQAPKFNQGIPIHKIRERLGRKGIVLGA